MYWSCVFLQCSAGTYLKDTSTIANLYTNLQGKKATFDATTECGQVQLQPILDSAPCLHNIGFHAEFCLYTM